MSSIVLATLNARYFHASLGLRYLLANLGPLREDTELMEFTIDQRPADLAERLLASNPKIIGLGVYIWNVVQTTELVAILKQVRPDIIVVLGGPEVSYECDEQRIVQLADYVVTGQGDLAFAHLCAQLMSGRAAPHKIIATPLPALNELQLPYREYTDEDVAHRFIYVEASRGCPYKCEFCLSALDKTAWPFPLQRFLDEMDALYQRGARHFKFVDRTFNLKIDTSIRIMEFFLERLDERLFLHFELIPDHLPERLKAVIQRFPPGSLQFEVGIQSFDRQVQELISRRQDNDKACANIAWLRRDTHAHLHTDLIAGLPGEDLAGFAASFDRLIALDPHEIQVGILKRLRGAPIARRTADFTMRYNPQPPYSVLATDRMDFITLQRLNRFARYWDLIGNSGRFRSTRPLLLGESPFARFLALSDWLYAQTGRTHQIALDRLFELVYRGSTALLGVPVDLAATKLAEDWRANGGKTALRFLPASGAHSTAYVAGAPARQRRHMP